MRQGVTLYLVTVFFVFAYACGGSSPTGPSVAPPAPPTPQPITVTATYVRVKPTTSATLAWSLQVNNVSPILAPEFITDGQWCNLQQSGANQFSCTIPALHLMSYTKYMSDVTDPGVIVDGVQLSASVAKNILFNGQQVPDSTVGKDQYGEWARIQFDNNGKPIPW